MELSTKEILIKTFEFFYRNISEKVEDEHFKLSKLNYTESMLILKFESFLQEEYKSLGLNWYFDFFSYQFQFWVQLKDYDFNKVGVSHIIGPKAYKRWLNKSDQSWKYFVRKNLLSKYRDLSVNNLSIYLSVDIEKERYDRKIIVLSKAEEDSKRALKLLNEGGDELLVSCIALTTLAHPKSSICKKCNMLEKCKKFQKINYPDIYQKRWQNENK